MYLEHTCFVATLCTKKKYEDTGSQHLLWRSLKNTQKKKKTKKKTKTLSSHAIKTSK